MTLHVHRSERADPLVAGLAELLRTTPDDPFAPDLVAVPARGVERWLTQRLSHHLGGIAADGVCANVRFPSPRTLTADAVTAASGVDPDQDLWAPGRVVWALLEVIDSCAAQDWCRALGRHLDHQGRRLVAAQHVGGLFSAYSQQRPQMLRDWAADVDSDGAGARLADDVAWQPELWRRLRDRIGAPGPAERLAPACEALRDAPALIDLPHRISLFGPTGLTTEQVTVLAALAEHRDVHLWLPHPSNDLWEKVRADPGTRERRRTDPTASAAGNRLLASLGRDTREMQLVLAQLAPAATDEYHPLRDDRDSLLGRIQHDLRTDSAPPSEPIGAAADARPVLDADDRSLQVHACHGRARQVEVLREVLLGLLEADETLEPRDVLVMCPDIEAYAPLISATFGLADADAFAAHPGHRLRVRLADRSLRQTNPLLATLGRLLELADSRVTASHLLDLATMPPVARRFGFDDEALERVRDWVGASGIRWGLDSAGRAPFRMEGVAQNTWQAGLDRVLLGVSMSEDDLRWVGLALPLDDVDSSDIRLAGRVAEFVDRLGTTLHRLSPEQPLADWLDALGDALDMLTDVSERDAWQLAQARSELADVAASVHDAESAPTLGLGDVRALLADRLRGRPTRAGFRTGNLTMCSMVPMRSVPHRVICLLGLDDGVFPRTPGVDGDDILARDPLVGERDRRSEDRQLLLDAVLAAQEHLVVLYTGADERTNTECPPAVPVGEIFDVVDATVRLSSGHPASGQVVVRHPLQPFDPRNFTAGALGAPGPFSFDRTSLAGARAAAKPRHDPDPFLAKALAALPAGDPIDLAQLIRFLEHPVKGFFRQRLGVAQPEQGEVLDDALHAGLDPLATWSVGDRWLRQRIGGASTDACLAAEWRRGALPPGALGSRLLDNIAEAAEPLLLAGAEDRVGDASAVDVAVTLPDGRIVAGTVPGVHGATVARTTYSRLAAKHRLRAWVQVLMLAASHPDRPWRAATIGQGKHYPVRSVVTAPGPDAAVATLEALVGLCDRGLCEPLPLPLGVSLAYAERRHEGDSDLAAVAAARTTWDKGFERGDPEHVMVWGPDAGLDDLMAAPPSTDDQPDDGTHRERSRFGALACGLWFPLLDAETVDNA
ncbi:MAG: exodeoxyribonuclease V subunit gamma [Nocardioidaceae bacterium]